jgi:hypothetical protein
MEPWTPFNQRFESCDADTGEWKLVVHVHGTRETASHVDYYRERPRSPDANWRLPFAGETTPTSQWVDVTRYVTSFEIGCGFGTEGGSSGSEARWSVTDTASGVDIAIGLEVSENGTKSPTQTAAFSVPFRRAMSGRQGSLEYQASWQHMK